MADKKFNVRKRIFNRAGLLRDNNKCYPLMEGISSRRFEIEEGFGSTDNKERIVRVPLDDSDRSRRVRVHEMAHAVISPTQFMRPANIERMAMQRAEDLRCNAWNAEIGHDSELKAKLATPSVIKKHVAQPIKDNPAEGRMHAASAAMATKGTKDYDPIIKGIKSVDEKFGDLVERFCDARWEVAERHAVKNPVETRRDFAGGFEESVVNAEMLMELVETNEMPEDAYNDGEESGDGEGEGGEGGEEDADGDPSEGKVGKGKYKDRNRQGMVYDRERVDDSAFGWSAAEAEEAVEGYEDGEEPDERIEEDMKAIAQMIYAGDADPGKMEIVEPPRSYRLSGAMEGRARRAADIGRVPLFMDRWASDKNIFTEQGKRPGGCSVLIDTSGSMSLSMDEIEEILFLMPAATIASYSGGGSSRNSGKLVILAKNGRRISQKQFQQARSGLSNIVDIPALEWLCKQKGPRYWISDGYMTGVSDHGLKPEYYDYVKVLSRRYKIYRIPCVSERRRKEHNSQGHGHKYSLEKEVTGGKRRRKVRHTGHMIGNLDQC